jgi:hypothetical protein
MGRMQAGETSRPGAQGAGSDRGHTVSALRVRSTERSLGDHRSTDRAPHLLDLHRHAAYLSQEMQRRRPVRVQAPGGSRTILLADLQHADLHDIAHALRRRNQRGCSGHRTVAAAPHWPSDASWGWPAVKVRSAAADKQHMLRVVLGVSVAALAVAFAATFGGAR